MAISAEWKERVRRLFPALEEGVSLEFTSEVDFNYNCLAWSVSCDTQYFENEKGCFWPWANIPDDTSEGWAQVCQIHGFVSIPVENTDFVLGIEKIAILENENGELHAARQREDGWWKSKLGGWGPDIDHVGLDEIKGAYGEVVRVLQRMRPDWLINENIQRGKAQD
jgi:hypothetical protein